jgi:hypothetical protein
MPLKVSYYRPLKVSYYKIRHGVSYYKIEKYQITGFAQGFWLQIACNFLCFGLDVDQWVNDKPECGVVNWKGKDDHLLTMVL